MAMQIFSLIVMIGALVLLVAAVLLVAWRVQVFRRQRSR